MDQSLLSLIYLKIYKSVSCTKTLEGSQFNYILVLLMFSPSSYIYKIIRVYRNILSDDIKFQFFFVQYVHPKSLGGKDNSSL